MTIRSFFDQRGSPVSFNHPPQKIISLVPSQTELLFDLGLDRQVIGITKYCVHPPTWQNTKTIIGGTKNFSFEIIDRLKPDLIIGNKEENYEAGILQLRQKYPVWLSDVVTLKDAYSMITAIGSLTNTEEKAATIITMIEQSFHRVRRRFGQSVLYLIWRKPWMAAGNNTFIDSMLRILNLTNVLADVDRYPVLTAEELQSLKADCILLSSEPFPFREKHIAELSGLCPSSKIVLVDGEMFSWYGSRLVQSADYFNSLTFE